MALVAKMSKSGDLDPDFRNAILQGVPKLHQLTLNNNAIKDIHRDLFAGTYTEFLQ
jgi:hypothetical protein